MDNYLKCKWIKYSNKRTYSNIHIITLNVNGVMLQPKEWIKKKKQDTYICCPQENFFRSRDTYRLKMRRWKKVFYTNGNKKKAEVAILVLDKVNFKVKTVTRDKEGHYIMNKGTIQEE